MMIRKAGIVAALCMAALGGVTWARADSISAMPDEDGKSIAYTPCEPGEEAAECLVFTITCQPNEVFGTGLELTVIGQGGGENPDIRSLARTMLDKPYGEQTLAFTVGSKVVEIPVSAVTLWGNELNGDWDLSVRSMDPGAFYDALTEVSSSTVSAAVGNFTAQLADTKSEGASLMAFKKACLQ